MGKHIVRIRLHPLIMVVALVASMSAGCAQAASHPPSARPVVGAVAAAAAPGLAPCTTPLPPGDTYCQSTSPVVDRWWDSYRAASSCTVRWTIDWGDGSKIWTGTFVDESPGEHLLASHTYNAKLSATYTETVTSSIVSGPCSGAASYYFVFDHETSAWQAWWDMYGMPKACIEDLFPDPVDMGLSVTKLGYGLGVFSKAGRWFVVFGVTKAAGPIYTLYNVLFRLPFDCAPQADPPLPRALDYGASHLGKLFKPSGTLPQVPQITGIDGYQKGSLVYFSLSYADPGHDAKGFGFIGVNGAKWALENHPFSNPSYGVVGNDRIDYPFNLACGTAQQYKSYVEAWIYDSLGIRSNPVEVALSCTP